MAWGTVEKKNEYTRKYMAKLRAANPEKYRTSQRLWMRKNWRRIWDGIKKDENKINAFREYQKQRRLNNLDAERSIDRERWESLSDPHVRKYMVRRIGGSQELLRKYPVLVEIQRLIIKINRECR